jgi:hypothetical protein
MIVQDLRTAVRLQLDLDATELTDTLIDLYLLEAFQQTTANENRWPWLESSWSVYATADGVAIPLPDDFGVAASVISSDGVALDHFSHEDAENYFAGDDEGGVPFAYSLWGDGLYLWPRANADLTYTLRGWRTLSEEWTTFAGASPDCDSRLHPSMVHYAISRAYAGQEDEVLSNLYLSTWRSMVTVTMTAIMRARYQGRVLMGRGVGAGRSRSRSQRILRDFL